MVLLSEKQQRDLLIVAGLADFLVGGKLTAAARTAVVATLKRALPVAGRAAMGAMPRAVGTARLLAMRHPWIAAGAVIYVGVTEREKIRTLLEQGDDIVEERFPTPSPPPSGTGISEIITSAYRPPKEIGGGRAQFGEETLAVLGLPPLPRRRKKPSAFNKAVKAGMAAVKKSSSYGKKGTISPAKKAFAVVTKLAAAKKKKKKAPKKGIRRLIWNAMKGLR